MNAKLHLRPALTLMTTLIISFSLLAGIPMTKNTKVKYGLYFQVEVINHQISDKVYQRYQTVEQFAMNGNAFNYKMGVFAKYTTAHDEVAFLKANNIDAEVIAFFNNTGITMEEAIVLASNQSKYESGLSIEGNEISLNDLNKLLYGNGKGMELTYRVYLGTFVDKQPMPDLNTNLTFQTTPEGFYTYVTDDFATRSNAIRFRKEAVANGVVEAFVVPYLNGKRISLMLAEAISDIQSSDLALLTH